MPLSDIPELLVYAHREEPEYFGPCFESIARTTPGTVRVLKFINKAGVHENMKLVLDLSTSRYPVYVDEDVQFLDYGWLDVLIQDLKDNPTLGAVATAQVKEYEHKYDYEQWAENNPMESRPNGLEVTKWFPAHVAVIDRARVPLVQADVNIPGIKGMSDLDFCLQIRKAGYDVGIDRRVVVYHPHKLSDENERLKLANPTLADEQLVFPQQVLYMWKKWGTMYSELVNGFNDQWLPRIRAAFEKDGTKCPW